MNGLSAEAEGLLRAVEAAGGRRERCHAGGCPPDCRLVGQIERLLRLTDEGSSGWCIALRLLCQCLATSAPWRASLCARKLLSVDPHDAEGWALLGLSLSLQEHPRAAASAYRRALALCPTNAVAAHNLGHLYDVCFDDPRRALPWLRRAQRALPGQPEVVASLAHALGRAGHDWEALALMKPLLQRPAPAHHHELYCALLERCLALLPTPAAREQRPRRRLRRMHTCPAQTAPATRARSLG